MEFPFTNSAGTIIEIIVSLVSSVAVLVVGVLIGIYFWNNRYINKKRRGNFKTVPFYLLKMVSSFLFFGGSAGSD